MKRLLMLSTLTLPLMVFSACGKGDHYKVTFKALRQNTQPASGFKVDAWIKGKSENDKRTKVTDASGIAQFDDLAQPDVTHPLVTVLHYYNGAKDNSRQITYPYIDSDRERLKDTQYIPNDATPEPK